MKRVLSSENSYTGYKYTEKVENKKLGRMEDIKIKGYLTLRLI